VATSVLMLNFSAMAPIADEKMALANDAVKVI
jgi:hypothetical protein